MISGATAEPICESMPTHVRGAANFLNGKPAGNYNHAIGVRAGLCHSKHETYNDK